MRFLCVTSLFCCLLLSSLPSFSQKSKLVSVTVEHTDLATQTLVAVDCAQFKNTFKSPTKHAVTKQADLLEFEKATKYFILRRQENKIDVRGTITFNYRHKAIKYCFDRYNLFYRDGKYLKNQLLLEVILKQVHTDE